MRTEAPNSCCTLRRRGKSSANRRTCKDRPLRKTSGPSDGTPLPRLVSHFSLSTYRLDPEESRRNRSAAALTAMTAGAFPPTSGNPIGH